MTTTPDLVILLARLEVKLDQALGATSDHESRLRKVEAQMNGSTDHETRIKQLEGRRWPLPVLASVTSAISLVVAVVGMGITR